METPPITLVIFGASGDLTARKLIPSLFSLYRKGRLPKEVHIVGVARSPFSHEAFRDKMKKGIQEFAPSEWDAAAWNGFASQLFYASGDATQAAGLEALTAFLKQREGERGGGWLYYLAVSPDLAPEIVNRLGEAGLASDNGRDATHGWRRLVIEKPFGHDLQSARTLNQTLRRHFREDQIYRIDHYLGKETVQNILVFRFANTLFEPLWNHNFIDHVQITVSETVKVGDRGPYYDKAGVLRDMFQNHLLQLLTLVAMEAPARFAADPLRNEKVKVLDAIPIYSTTEAAQNVVAAQYAGYRAERGVEPKSPTPTFAVVQLHIDNWRWRGVPFYLRSGKSLAQRSSEVIIQFRCPPHLMFPLPAGATLQCNRLSICIQPDEGIHLNFQSKVPDRDGVVLRPADLEFHYRNTYGEHALPESYERLLQDALHGDASLFMRSDEIERAWEIMDPIIAAVEHPEAGKAGLVEEYAPGSEGPRCADELLARTGRAWLSLCRHPH
jgi:glucose-6-phosphate 1-dehydrogenase